MRKKFPRRHISDKKIPGSNVLKYRLGTLWPDKLAVKMGMKYFETVVTGLYPYGQIDRVMNYINDIGTSLSIQPADYDRLSSVYRRYKVVGYKIYAKYFNLSSDPLAIINFHGRDNTDLSATSGTRVRCVNQPGAKEGSMNTLSSGENRMLYTKYIKVRKWFPEQDSDDLSSVATTATAPTSPMYWVTNFYHISGTSTINFSQHIYITFYVVWDGLLLQTIDTTPVT